jgi:tetratricopeptide (TPR) repeat protein
MRLATLLVGLSLLCGRAEAGVSWAEGSLHSALRKARSEHKLVFVDVFATWCGPCQEMDVEAYPRDEVGRMMDGGFIALRRDGERGEGLEIAQRYHVVGFPTMLVLDDKGSEIDRLMGGLSGLELLQQLERVKARKGTLAELEKTLAKAPTEPLKLEVATRHAIRGEARAVGELTAVIAADPDNKAHRAANAMLVLGKYYYLRGSKDYAAAEKTLLELQRRFAGSDEAAQTPYHLALAQLRGGKTAEARATLDAWIAASPKDAERYASAAWFCFKESNDRARGIELAKKGLAIAPNEDGMWDTLGELYLATGDRAEARKAWTRAIELAPKKDYYKVQLARTGGAP